MVTGYRLIAGLCLAAAIATWATLVPAFIDPPPWNRAGRFLLGFGWFYLGYLHWRIDSLERAAGEGGDEG